MRSSAFQDLLMQILASLKKTGLNTHRSSRAAESRRPVRSVAAYPIATDSKGAA